VVLAVSVVNPNIYISLNSYERIIEIIMFSLKSSTRPGFTFISPWLLAAATGLLVMIVVTFAINNMQRKKWVMLNGMLQKGVTMIRVAQSGAKSSAIAEIRRGIRNQEAGTVACSAGY
jgi:hypothetical protein